MEEQEKEETNSEFCKRMQEKCLEEDNTGDAYIYFELYNYWKEKGM